VAPLYTAPLLDAILLLLIFFLLGSNFILKSGVAVELPFSDSSLPSAARSHIITVSPGETTRVFFNEDRVTLEELDTRLAEEIDRARQVILLVDIRTDFGTAMKLANAVLRHGYELAFATSSGEQ
jgi:biopolymer transport protein ExbD